MVRLFVAWATLAAAVTSACTADFTFVADGGGAAGNAGGGTSVGGAAGGGGTSAGGGGAAPQVCPLPPPGQGPGENRLINGSFQTWLNPDAPASWTVAGTAQRHDEGCDGTRSAAVDFIQYENVTQEVHITGGGSGIVHAEAWFRAREADAIAPHLLMSLYDDNGNQFGQQFLEPVDFVTDGWTMAEVSLPLMPPVTRVLVSISNQQSVQSTTAALVDGVWMAINP
jgi:hypothetical protein